MKIVASENKSLKTGFDVVHSVVLHIDPIPSDKHQKLRLTVDEAKALHRSLEAILYPY